MLFIDQKATVKKIMMEKDLKDFHTFQINEIPFTDLIHIYISIYLRVYFYCTLMHIRLYIFLILFIFILSETFASQSKRFGSEPDLRTTDEIQIKPTKIINKNMKKKYKAPPPPQPQVIYFCKYYNNLFTIFFF